MKIKIRLAVLLFVVACLMSDEKHILHIQDQRLLNKIQQNAGWDERLLLENKIMFGMGKKLYLVRQEPLERY